MADIPRSHITGLVLAGGRGSRMGGVDKGLQLFCGQPLAWRAIERLGPQVGQVAINANRNIELYQRFGVPVWPDALPDHPGPLAGFLAGMEHCGTPWLVTMACDTPLLPLDLVARLAAGIAHQPNARIAMAWSGGRSQPVCCLLHTLLAPSLKDYLDRGERQVERWMREHEMVAVTFDDDPQAFANANTLEELQILEREHG
jgi:molybdopterin-guanine dinucleotide biosynthesis protein A